MPTDPNPSLAPHSPSEPLPAELAQALAAGLGPFSLRELLALILNSLSQAERQAFLAGAPADKGNGSYARSLKMGSSPVTQPAGFLPVGERRQRRPAQNGTGRLRGGTRCRRPQLHRRTGTAQYS